MRRTLLICLMLVLTPCACVLLQRRSVETVAAGCHVHLALSRGSQLFDGWQARLYIERSGQDEQVAEILHQVFEQPLLLIPGRRLADPPLLFYMYDTHLELLAFDLARATLTRPSGFPLDHIVLSTGVAVRRGTEPEKAWLREFLETASSADFHKASVATLDFGIFRLYASRSALIDSLAHVQLENQAKPLPGGMAGQHSTPSGPWTAPRQ